MTTNLLGPSVTYAPHNHFVADGDESHTEEHHNELGEKFTQQIIERPQNVNLILTLLEVTRLRW